MLEILLLIFISRKLAAIAQEKGRAKGWGALGVGFWILGELMGFIVGGAMNLGAGAYGVALVFAGIGAAVAFAVVKGLSPASSTGLAA